MKRSGRVMPLVIVLLLLLGVLYFTANFGKMIFVDKATSVTDLKGACGVNVITVGNSGNTTQFRKIVSTVRNAISGGGNGKNIVVVCGELTNADGDYGNTVKLIDSLANIKAIDALVVYSNTERVSRGMIRDIEDAGGIWLPNEDVILSLPKEGESNSFLVEWNVKLGLALFTDYVATDANEILITAYDPNEANARKGIETDPAGFKIVVGDYETTLSCDIYIATMEDGPEGKNILSTELTTDKVSTSSSSFDVVSGEGHLLVTLGVSKPASKSFSFEKHSICLIEVTNLLEEPDEDTDDTDDKDEEDSKDED